MARHLGRNNSQRARSLLSSALAMVFLTTVCIAAYWVGIRAGGNSSPGESGLTVETRFLDFGEVWEDSDFHWKLPIRNTTAQEMEILDFATSCTCVSLQPRNISLAPGGSSELDLRLDLTRRQQLSKDQGIFGTLILPKIKGTVARTPGWTLHGKVRELLKYSPPMVLFGDLIRGQPIPGVSVKVASSLPLSKLETKGKDSNACVKVTQKSTRDFELIVIPADTLPPGPFRLEIPLEPTGTGGQILPAKKMIVMGIMHELVEPTPSPLILGALPLGQTAEETIVLRPLTGKPFKVVGFQPLSDGLQVKRVETRDNKVPIFVVSQKGIAVGDQWSEAIFRVQVQNESLREIHLKVLYHGQEEVPAQ